MTTSQNFTLDLQPCRNAISATFDATDAWFEASETVLTLILESVRMTCLAYVEADPTAFLRGASV